MTISAPTDISGCRWWLDATDAGTFTFYSGVNVQTWNDKSGNATHWRDFTGNSPAPTRNGSQNGLTTVVFPSGAGGGEDSGISESQPISVFVVMKVSATSWSGVFSGGAGAGTGVQIRRRGDAGGANIEWRAGGTETTTALDNTNYHLITGIFNGSSSVQRVDKTAVATANVGSGGVTRMLLNFDGDNNKLTAEYAEVVVYEVAISGSDLTDVEDYLYNRWFGAPAFDPPELQHPPFQQNVYRM